MDYAEDKAYFAIEEGQSPPNATSCSDGENSVWYAELYE